MDEKKSLNNTDIIDNEDSKNSENDNYNEVNMIENSNFRLMDSVNNDLRKNSDSNNILKSNTIISEINGNSRKSSNKDYNFDLNSEAKLLNGAKFDFNEVNGKNNSKNEFEMIKKLVEKQNKIMNKQKNIDTNDKDALISVENLYKSYLLGLEGIPALRGINLNINQGEFVIIVGTSGGGKTTLLNCIGTIDKPTRGTLKIENKMILDTTKDNYLTKLRQDKIGFVFQNFNLINSFSTLENVKLPMLIKNQLKESEINEKAKNLLKKFNLEHRLNSYPNQLSGGEQQRVTIARALSNNPSLLLLDEPTGDLDTKNTDIVLNYLIDLNTNENITIVMVTHEEELKNYANRIVSIQDGKIKNIFKNNLKKREETIKKLKEKINNVNLKKEPKNKTIYKLPTDYQYFKFIQNNL